MEYAIARGIMTEIRDLGDGKAVVLYTNDTKIWRAFRDLSKCFKSVRYEQEQKGNDKLVGVDLYFPKKYQKWLERKLGVLGITIQGVS